MAVYTMIGLFYTFYCKKEDGSRYDKSGDL